MSDLNDKPMDDLFREHLGDDVPIPYDEKYWEQAQAMMAAKPRRRRWGFWFWTGLTLLLLGTGTGIFLFRSQPNTAPDLADMRTNTEGKSGSTIPKLRETNRPAEKSSASLPSSSPVSVSATSDVARSQSESSSPSLPEKTDEKGKSKNSAGGKMLLENAEGAKAIATVPFLPRSQETKSGKRSRTELAIVGQKKNSGRLNAKGGKLRKETPFHSETEKKALSETENLAGNANLPVGSHPETSDFSTSISQESGKKPESSALFLARTDSVLKKSEPSDSLPEKAKSEPKSRKDTIQNFPSFGLQLGVLAASQYGERLNQNQGYGVYAGLNYQKPIGKKDFLRFGAKVFSRPGDSRSRVVNDSIFQLRLEVKQTDLRATMAIYSGLQVEYGRWFSPRHMVRVGVGCTYLVQTYNRIETRYQGQTQRKERQTGFRSGLALWDAQALLGYEYKLSPRLSLGMELQLGFMDQTRSNARKQTLPTVSPVQTGGAERKDRNQFLLFYLRQTIF